MPTFQTPQAISVSLELAVGNARIVASERTDTVVDVRPTDEHDEHDVRAAAETRVDFGGGTLRVKAPRPKWRGRDVGSIDVTIELPTGSSLRGDGAVVDIAGTGRLGECRYSTAAGQLRFDHTGPANLTTAAGDVTVDRADGDVEISSGSGDVRIGAINGAAVIKNSNGQTWVGETTGDVRLNTANGGIVVDRALADVDARTANGSVRIGEVVRGSVELESGMGGLEVGVREGTAAWLDAKSAFGNVHSSLNAADSPAGGDERVTVRARTSFGDILIRRA